MSRGVFRQKGSRHLAAVACLLGCWTASRPARAWIFPEHADITERALKDLDARADAATRVVLAGVRVSLHLCADGQGAGECPTLAALAALAGDHSCTPHELDQTLYAASKDQLHWVHGVLRVAGETRKSLKDADRDSAKRADVRRQMHVDLQSVDSQYLARALIDFSHFQLARESGSRGDLGAYLDVALAPTAQANATAAYANYHIVAVRLAAAVHAETDPAKRARWLARAFLAEAFAAHFLEDSFSSGHFVGHWGDDATRLGTHDFYSAAGVEAAKWMSPTDTFVAHGDAFLSDAETTTVADAVRMSLQQVMSAATDVDSANRMLAELQGAFGEEQYDSCNRAEAPLGLVALRGSTLIRQVVENEPIPAARFPALARVRAEKGPFIGGAATAGGGYEPQTRTGGEEIRGTLRVGFGAAGVVDDPLNAQAFVEAGFVGQYLMHGDASRSLTGYSFRIRAPGYIMLVDGMVAVILAQAFEADCPFCLSWGSKAAGGGLGKLWRSCPLFGSFTGQFSALRDVSVNWFRNELGPKRDRWEILAPVFTARSVLPIAGDGISQSTDFYIDVGPSMTVSADRQKASFGAFASFAMATRLFP